MNEKEKAVQEFLQAFNNMIEKKKAIIDLGFVIAVEGDVFGEGAITMEIHEGQNK